jgi:branched-chain amino acid transport system ATP-binding protein
MRRTPPEAASVTMLSGAEGASTQPPDGFGRAVRAFSGSLAGQQAARRGVGLLAILGILVVPLLDPTPYAQSVSSLVATDAILGLSATVLMGYAGELSFAYAALFGAAGYFGYVAYKAGVPELLALILGFLGCIALGTLVALPAVRIRGLQLALVTFSFSLGAADIFARISGDSGVIDLPEVKVFGTPLFSPKSVLIYSVVLLVVVYVAVEWILNSGIGRRFLLLKADDATARSLGIHVSRQRALAFGISAGVLGIIGAAYPDILGLLSPDSYSFGTVITILLVVFVGGVSRSEGAIVGAIIVVLIGQALQKSPGNENIAYGVFLFVVLLVAREGVLGIAGTAARFAVDLVTPSAQPKMITPPPASVDLARAVVPKRPIESVQEPFLLQATGVSKSYGQLTAVDRVDVGIPSGLITGIVGANGAGKSTLLDLLTGFQAADHGRLIVRTDGHERDATRFRPERMVALGVVRTFQFPMLVPELTVRQNVAIAVETVERRRSVVREAVDQVLYLMGLDAVADDLPESLPYGTRKLVDIARAVALKPKVLMLDEPAAGLGDAELPILIATVRSEAARGVGVVIIEHNTELIAEVSDHVIALDYGRMIGAGAALDVLNSELVKRSYLGADS